MNQVVDTSVEGSHQSKEGGLRGTVGWLGWKRVNWSLWIGSELLLQVKDLSCLHVRVKWSMRLTGRLERRQQ